jgi:hypothetical protein
MLAALFFIAGVSAWVPARWASSDPASLDLLKDTPINCLLLEQRDWSTAFHKKAAERNIAVLGVIRPDGDGMQAVRTAKEQALTGVVLEGDLPDAAALRKAAQAAELAVVELPVRVKIAFDSSAPILGTSQGVFPGIKPVDEKEGAHAAPSGGPWIDTNAGFLRYARAMHKGEFWMGVTPPEGQVLPIDRYFMAIGDAAMVGARWIVALDSSFTKRLLSGEEQAVKDWKRIGKHLAFYEQARPYRDVPSFGRMAVVQDADSGALLSGSVLDMISVKHTPIRPVPGSRLSLETLKDAKMAVNVYPDGLSTEQKEVLKDFTRKGGTVLNGPPGWKMPSARADQITVDAKDVEKLDQIWKEMNTMINRQNLGVRLFNVSSMLSYFQAESGGKRAVLHLVNYSGYPIESVTAHVLGRFKKAWIETPEGARKAVEPYDVDEGEATGVDIDVVPAFAIIHLEP